MMRCRSEIRTYHLSDNERMLYVLTNCRGFAHLNGLYLVTLLILRVHGHKFEYHKVEYGGYDGQAEHDEEEGEGDILRLLLESIVLL